MSGGSFNYVCDTYDLADLLQKRRDWQDLADAFETLGVDDVAADIVSLLAYLNLAERRIAARVERLRDVAKAMEWWKSCDSSEDRVRAAVEAYRSGAPAPALPTVHPSGA